MGTTVVLGMQAGDEGKGKIVDMLASQSDFVVRFQGGANAGHTIVADGEEFISHLLPSGSLYENVTLGIGRGVVLDLQQLDREVREIESRTKFKIQNRLFIDEGTTVLMPYHRILDLAQELTQNLGTTGRGIGPAYEDEVGRRAIRTYLLHDKKRLHQAVNDNCSRVEALIRHAGVDKNKFTELFHLITEKDKRGSAGLLDLGLLSESDLAYEKFLHGSNFNVNMITETFHELGKKYAKCMINLVPVLREAAKKRLLLEGAQACELDKRWGVQPSVTSSHTLLSEASAGSGMLPSDITKVIGVCKAYTTKVGAHIFPTEIDDPVLSEKLKKVEFGATTGRQRMVGWHDLVQSRYYQMINGYTHIAITKLDLFSGVDTLKVAVAYRVDGKRYELPPSDPEVLKLAKPVYEHFDGWTDDISGCRSYAKLPKEARKYVEFIVKQLNTVSNRPVRLAYIGVGPARGQIIKT